MKYIKIIENQCYMEWLQAWATDPMVKETLLSGLNLYYSLFHVNPCHFYFWKTYTKQAYVRKVNKNVSNSDWVVMKPDIIIM